MSDLARREFERILLIKPSSPGDIIHALPVLRKLRRRYPQAHIAWLVANPFINLVDADPALSEVIPFDRKRFGKLGRSFGVTLDFIGFVRSLRARRFDLVIDLQGLSRSGFMSIFSGAKVRVGFRDSRELAWLFYNHRIPKLPVEMHAADKNLSVGPLLGLDEAPPDFRVATKEEDDVQAAALLATVGLSANRPFIMLVPGTRWDTKRWAVERYGQLARIMKDRHGVESVLVGGPTEVEDGRIAENASRGAGTLGASPAAHNLCGRTTFRQLAALTDKAAVVVTADSAPMHIAAAHGRPLVALFGPTNPVRTGPYEKLDDVLRLPLDCSPCYYRRLSQCPIGQKCMKDLRVEMVAEAVGKRLSTQ